MDTQLQIYPDLRHTGKRSILTANALLWAVPLGGTRLASVEKDGLVFGTSNRGEIVALDPKDGSIARRIDIAKLEAAKDAPKIIVQRGALPAKAEFGDLSAPARLGDVFYVTTAAGWTIALRIPPFRSRTER